MARGNQTDRIGNPYSLDSQRRNLELYVKKVHRRDAIIEGHQEELKQIEEVTERRVWKVQRMRAIIERQNEEIMDHRRTERRLQLELAKMRRKIDGAKHGFDMVLMWTRNTSVEPIVMDEDGE